MSTQRSGKTLIITDDEEVQDEELNPFSFREFLRWKNQDPGLDQDLDHLHTHSKQTVCLSSQEEEEDTYWGQSLQSDVDSMSSFCAEEETRFSCKPKVPQRGGAEHYGGDDETSVAEPHTSYRSSKIKQLQEENVLLRRTIRELKKNSEDNEHRVLELSEELFQKRRQEEKEAQDLESMVQSVEQNLYLMTKRAVKAENSVSRLKAELQQLQVEVESLRSENDSLKAAESDIIVTMRNKAQMASEYLNKTASHAHSSICQLMDEAETLQLVSQLLQSIDKISNLNQES